MNKTLERFGALSESIIPAVHGEYYSYSSEFTDEKPLYVLMKCKANKARTIASAEELGHEANLLFLFGDTANAQVYDIREAYASGILDKPVDIESFGQTWVSPADISAEDFYNLRSREDVETMVAICKKACSDRNKSAQLSPGTVIAMMTDGGKYGMFHVRQLTPTSIRINACHILL